MTTYMNSRNLIPRHSFHDFPMFPLFFIGHAEQIPLDTQRFFQGCGTLASTWKIRATMNFDVKTPSNQRSLANEILPKMLLHFGFFGFWRVLRKFGIESKYTHPMFCLFVEKRVEVSAPKRSPAVGGAFYHPPWDKRAPSVY